LLAQSILIPDFALTRAGRRLYVEILGFWTPAYRERKIQKLQHLKGRGDLILAIPSEARPAFLSLAADFPIVWYDGQLSATELLYLLRNRYDDFAARLAMIDVAIVRERLRNLGLLSEQACYDLLHCYRRSELQRAAEHVVCEDIAFTPGIGLYQIDWLEQMKRSFVEWMDALEVAPLPLVDVLQAWKARWPMLADYQDTALEALLALWPEIRVHRTSIFDAIVEVSRPELRTPDLSQDREEAVAQAAASPLAEREMSSSPPPQEAGVQGAAGPLAEREVSSPLPISLPPQAAKKNIATALPLQDEDNTKKQVREQRAKYKKRSPTRTVQEDLWS